MKFTAINYQLTNVVADFVKCSATYAANFLSVKMRERFESLTFSCTQDDRVIPNSSWWGSLLIITKSQSVPSFAKWLL